MGPRVWGTTRSRRVTRETVRTAGSGSSGATTFTGPTATMSPLALLTLGWLVSSPPAPVDFATGILPVLTQAGCNSGACHGAAAGRGGFRLSLWGADPSADYDAIVQAEEGRRINLRQPTASLLLLKPTGQRDHGGGVPLDSTSPGVHRLREWILAGAPRGTVRRLTKFTVEPARHHCLRPGETVAYRALAHFDGGPAEDVTPWIVLTADDPTAVEIDPESHTARPQRPGSHVLIARYLQHVLPLQWTVPWPEPTSPPPSPPPPPHNPVDVFVQAMLDDLRLPVSPPADEATFLRRIHLDLTGQLPEREEVEAFLADPAPDKRARQIDRLLARDSFLRLWTLRYARILQLHSLPEEPAGWNSAVTWLRQSLATHQGWDQQMRELLAATGDSHVVGPAFIARLPSDARGYAEWAGQVFLGVRLQCAHCHNHPLDQWTQDDYHGLAALFARLERGREVRPLARGEVTNPRTGEPALPRLPGDRQLSVDEDGRLAFAQWLADPQRSRLARAHVNRLWRALFGRGLIEPVDDLRVTNPATHPELLEWLVAQFHQHRGDLHALVRLLVHSQAYGRVARDTASSEEWRFYAAAAYRPVEPEVLADMLTEVLGVPAPLGTTPLGTPAQRLVDPLAPAPTLDLLGRCRRPTACPPNSASPGLSARLHLLNGDLINARLVAPAGRLAQSLASGASDTERQTDFVLRALGRPPTPNEREAWSRELAALARQERSGWWEDWLWSLLNSRDFTHNR
ncbi:MAG: DUF1549 domain-containing protein [Pirellulales bacterium]